MGGVNGTTESRALPRIKRVPKEGRKQNGSNRWEYGPMEKAMYKGTLIDDLMAAVERTENSFCLDQEQESKLAYWYAVAQSELANLDLQNLDFQNHDFQNHNLAGVA